MSACRKLLWEGGLGAASAWEYLEGRGFDRETIDRALIGVNPETQFDDHERWGRDSDGKMWLPRGIVIPWIYAGDLWGLNIRRPKGDVEPEAEEDWKTRKYQRAAGSCNALFNADEMDGRPVALVEGEFDALAIQQESDQVTAVATGSTAWGRTARWRSLLRCAPIVLVCFDPEEAGEQASRYWTETMPNAFRWRPHLHDAAEMLKAGADIARWIDEGLDEAASVLA
jgi:DNA primase